jgi:hypothetical protein
VQWTVLKNQSKYFVLFALLVANAYSQELSLETVLRSTREHYPKIKKQDQIIASAESALQESLGAFDVKIRSELDGYVTGYYDGIQSKSYLQSQLPIRGNIEWFTGYRKSDGAFPVYRGELETLSDGEFFGGIRMDLLRGFGLDEDRLYRLIAEQKIIAEKSLYIAELMEAQEQAAIAYWEWVAYGLIRDSLKEIYDVSVDRDQALGTRVKKGDLANIAHVENQQNILQRRVELQNIEMTLVLAAQKLSLYFRDEKGSPIVPTENQRPHKLMPTAFTPSEFGSFVAQRPEIVKKDSEIQIVQDQLRFSKSLTLPELNLETQLKKDVGTGPTTLAGNEALVQLQFEFPFQNRKARGSRQKYDALLGSLRYERKLLEESFRVEYEQLLENLKVTQEIQTNLEKEVSLSEQLQKAEVNRWQYGDGDFFLVNLRELNLMRARIARVRNELASLKAQAQLNSLTMQFPK